MEESRTPALLERLFRLRENGTTVRTELRAGLVTFLTMSYIIFVQPAVLSQAGMDFGAVMAATCVSSAVAIFIMGLFANYPIALAPGMGENFFFAYTVVLGMGVSWQVALGAVFLSGVAFLLLSAFRIREMVIEAVPPSLQHAIGAAIGLFIAFIGLQQAGLIVGNPGSLVQLGDIKQPPVLLALTGLALTSVLMIRKVKGAILWGMLATAVLGLPFGLVEFHGLVSSPPSMSPTFFQMDVRGALSLPLVTFIFLYMVLFDTVGTVIGVSAQAGFLKDGKIPRAGRVLMADAIGTSLGAVCGTSTVTSYIESNAGVAEGGRTGLANMLTGLLFLLALFFIPVVQMVGGGYPVTPTHSLYPVTAPVMVLVGFMMARSLLKVGWDDASEGIPAFLTLVGLPLTYNIAHGLAFGFISYPVLKLLSGRGREVSWLIYLLGGLLILRYALVKG
ncbi:MAG: guanine permease [Candidatus Handelsmanbacteria bacterium RIFCSPLOWO2_12_FULL_64_10]|uniref:Guanine permease n=1 Tax=Handelsmanbacteria sp. (strain RIFCSPLOWO2_12_FULL_64_10) TaxID=1817868 RepID=A0A1F6D5A6_HANXR|nr:MAG: guanine permease [Candidatus Handelsmanbacteria bacterium RIFCSPLOWO2_12_FULL_64_10]